MDTSSPLTERQQKGLMRALETAHRLLRRRIRLLRLVKAGYRKLTANPKVLGRMRGDVETLLRLARAWARREYRVIPWKSMAFASAALLYFVNPADVIPDALVGIGYIDDLAVLSAVVRALQDDLNLFLAWETAPQALPEPEDSIVLYSTTVVETR